MLNLVLERVKGEKLSEWALWYIMNWLRPIYIDQPKSFANHMAQVLNIQSLSDLKAGKILIPERTENIIHYQLNISRLQNITIQVEEGRSWTHSWQKEKLKLYRDRGEMSFAEAEAFCISLGGHLASVHSEQENAEMLKIAEHPWE